MGRSGESTSYHVQETFDPMIKTETQIQVADSFKMEFNNNFTLAEINKISARLYL